MADDDWYDARFDPYMLAVGKIATVWAGLEFAINQAIWELCNVEAPVGACVTAQLIGPMGSWLTSIPSAQESYRDVIRRLRYAVRSCDDAALRIEHLFC
jgi:hypothetical protein